MSALVRDRSGPRERRDDRTRQRSGVRRRGDEVARGQTVLCDDLGGGPTLDDVLSGAWEGLAARTAVACPLCGGEMAPVFGAHAVPVGGRCSSCETTLG